MNIKDINLFHGNDESFYKKATENLILHKCKSKFVFFNEGDINNFEAYILKSGIVILSKISHCFRDKYHISLVNKMLDFLKNLYNK